MLQAGATRQAAKSTFFIALLSCLLAAPLAWAQQPVTGLVVFGDSLSDTGNAFVLHRVNNTPPDYDVDPLLIPTAAYPRGGHNLTNGAPWVQVLARSLGLAANAGPAFRSDNPRATNYAVAGARAYDDGINVNLADQVNRFLQDFGGSAPSEALYVIEIGGSDIRDALAFQDPSLIGQGLQAIADSIVTLYQAGARKFLVWNAPNIGSIPSILALEPLIPGISLIAQQASLQFNAGLEMWLAALEASLPGIEILRFDLYGTADFVQSNPGTFGLTNVIAACITPGVPPFTCRKPDEYFFWDGVHPTRAVHAIIAQQVEALLAQ